MSTTTTTTTTLEEAIALLLRDYREMRPIPSIVQAFSNRTITYPDDPELPSTNNWLDIRFQALFVSKILQDKHSLQFPPSLKFKTTLLSRYISLVEEHNLEVDEGLVAVYLESSNLSVTQDSKFKYSSNTSDQSRTRCYKSFFIGHISNIVTEIDSHILTIKTSQEFNLVGLTTWEAGMFLGEFAFANPGVFCNKKILELGAGVGLTSAMICKLQPQQFVITDYASPILDTIEHNLEINGINVSKTHSNENNNSAITTIHENSSSSIIEVKELNWKTVTVEEIIANGFHKLPLILAADVLYDPPLVDHFVKVVDMLLTTGDTASKQVYVAQTIRTQTTFNHFLEQLKKYPYIEHEDITQSASIQKVFQYPRTGIVLMVLKRQKE